MNQYKEKQVFSQGEPDDQAPDLDKKQTFSEQEFVVEAPISLDDDQALETDVEKALKPKKRGWKWRILLSVFSALLVWQLIDSFISAFTGKDYLALSWGALCVAISSVGFIALARELIKLRRLKGQAEIQEESRAIAQDNGHGRALPFCESINKSLFDKGVEASGRDKFVERVNATHSDRDVFKLYEDSVLSSIDARVSKLVAKYSSEAAVMVAVSPIAIADMALVVWRSLAMVSAISKAYGVELGYWSRIKLLRSIFVNMAAAGGSELVLDAGIDFLSMDMTAKLSSRAAQGVGVGLLTARLGIKAAELVRPIEFSTDNRIKLSHIRDRILGSVKQRLQLSIQKKHDKV
ncbi:YcjF family protein [Vibrio ishigakensis]|uniref:YcjF family protein n=1 Tax=Vibrio ishigakensis TaxID=1481914 RepID=UPI0021C2CACD|nr:YcjF family protein [Vibrio ishigakensis]